MRQSSPDFYRHAFGTLRAFGSAVIPDQAAALFSDLRGRQSVNDLTRKLAGEMFETSYDSLALPFSKHGRFAGETSKLLMREPLPRLTSAGVS